MSSSAEIERGERFAFGKNWSLFLRNLDDARIQRAEETLCEMLAADNLHGQRFLDIGSGSGLFSLAARRLGATVHSFDYDRDSVGCTTELKSRYFADDDNWTVEHGSVLDRPYLENLGAWDVVYSWGVLHHTGAMWEALENAAGRVASDGRLFIAIYNDQAGRSRRWATIKRLYNEHSWLRGPLLAYGLVRLWGPAALLDLARLQPFRTWRNYAQERGMSPWRDVVDWIGGWPFEVATPDVLVDHFRKSGFELEKLVTRQGHGCNEFVFKRR